MKMFEQINWSRLGGFIPTISFDTPILLWLLLLVPAMIAGYILLLRRRRRAPFVIPTWRWSRKPQRLQPGAGIFLRR